MEDIYYKKYLKYKTKYYRLKNKIAGGKQCEVYGIQLSEINTEMDLVKVIRDQYMNLFCNEFITECAREDNYCKVELEEYNKYILELAIDYYELTKEILEIIRQTSIREEFKNLMLYIFDCPKYTSQGYEPIIGDQCNYINNIELYKLELLFNIIEVKGDRIVINYENGNKTLTISEIIENIRIYKQRYNSNEQKLENVHTNEEVIQDKKRNNSFIKSLLKILKILK